MRRKKMNGSVLAINGADPLNLVGIVTPGQRVPSLPSNKVLYRDGVPIAMQLGDRVSQLHPGDDDSRVAVEAAFPK